MEIRDATAADNAFLFDMLVEAVNWTGEQRLAREVIAADPRLCHYVTDWPRPDDFGVVAVEPTHNPIGAAWARVFTADDPGFGYVAEDIPEISMGVAQPHRGRGIGSALLAALIAQALGSGWRELSLSVEDHNAAVVLYRRAGFETCGRTGGSDTMILDLSWRPSSR